MSNSSPADVWNIGASTLPETNAIQSEIEALEREAANKRREIEERLAVANAKQRAWIDLLQAGQAASAVVRHTREQADILRKRLDAALAKFDATVGKFYLSAEWFETQRADPLVERSTTFPPHPWSPDPTGEHPHVAMSKEILAHEWAIARIESHLPALERAEQEALRAAKDYAKREGIEHPFPDDSGEAEPPALAAKTKGRK